jgi:hypothetical protein
LQQNKGKLLVQEVKADNYGSMQKSVNDGLTDKVFFALANDQEKKTPIDVNDIQI